MVSRTKTLFYGSRPQRAQYSVLVLLPSPSRRSEFARHVYPSHGIRDIHTSLHAVGRSSGSIPSRGHGSDSHNCLCDRSCGNTRTQVWDLHTEHKQRQPTTRPRRILWIQVRGCHCHVGSSRDIESWERDRWVGRVDCFHVYVSGQCVLPREFFRPQSLIFHPFCYPC